MLHREVVFISEQFKWLGDIGMEIIPLQAKLFRHFQWIKPSNYYDVIHESLCWKKGRNYQNENIKTASKLELVLQMNADLCFLVVGALSACLWGSRLAKYPDQWVAEGGMSGFIPRLSPARDTALTGRLAWRHRSWCRHRLAQGIWGAAHWGLCAVFWGQWSHFSVVFLVLLDMCAVWSLTWLSSIHQNQCRVSQCSAVSPSSLLSRVFALCSGGNHLSPPCSNTLEGPGTLYCAQLSFLWR